MSRQSYNKVESANPYVRPVNADPHAANPYKSASKNQNGAKTEAIVAVPALNIRKSADAFSKVLHVARKGQPVQIRSDHDELWYKVKVGEVSGFAMKEFLSFEEEV